MGVSVCACASREAREKRRRRRRREEGIIKCSCLLCTHLHTAFRVCVCKKGCAKSDSRCVPSFMCTRVLDDV